MARYDYVLTSNSGVRTEGSIDASNLDAAQRKLAKKDKIILSITENKHTRSWFWQRPSLSLQDKMLFTKHMATMVKVGITITEGLEILISQTKEKNNKRMYENILEMVQSGQTLSKSLSNYDYIFPEVFINMIATGEQSGTLEQIFEYLDIQLEKEYELRKKVLSAFIYPAVIISVTILVVIGIVLFIMPRITKIFASFDVELPLITRALIIFSDFVTEQPLVAAGAFFVVISFFIFIFKIKILKPFWHRVVLHLPVFGKILIFSNLARFSRTMNSLLQSGVPVTEALDITGNMMTNSVYKKFIYATRDKVEQGANLGESLEGNEKLFPQLATKTLFIGEKTGSLEVTTKRLAELYEHDVDNITKNLSVLLEPLLLVFMAVLVGGVAISIILPIYQLPSLLQK